MKDGGPAFPFNETRYERDGGHVDTYVDTYCGMSLRDYFAAAALQGMITSEGHVKVMEECLKENPGSKPGEHVHIVIARLALSTYMIADAMLKERDK